MTESETLESRVSRCLSESGTAPLVDQALDSITEEFDARTLTLHFVEDGQLKLHSCRGLPQHLASVVANIPFGKGMAGLCAERREAVTVCNLQTDTSGVARPAAKDTGVEGAIVVPILEDENLVGTFGIGKKGDHDYTADEEASLRRLGEILYSALH